ncbi:pseudouridine synthase [Pseudozobellia sp. WGM2]|uniref:pseudouridine synthase n=1 Tax=Pseudozobellia sp. WGM2 TaxID=2787625 RepID=UPI001ADFADFD|nr:pseudouridine synthase [Pseudozobellia sp. WGM2]
MTDHIHYKLYKPFGMLSQLSSNDPKQIRKKRFLSELFKFPKAIMPIGRLDEKSEGLLLMTTDGVLSDTINRSGIEKEYYAQVDGLISDEAIEKIKSGVVIGIGGDKYMTKPCIIQKIPSPELPKPSIKLRIGVHRPTSWVSITLREGKFRQVRKMTAAVGYPTVRLIRIRIGAVNLEGLLPGQIEKFDHLPEVIQKK